MFLGIEFPAKELIFASLVREKECKSGKSQGTSFSKLVGNPVQNLNYDHEKSWKSTGKMHIKTCGNPASKRAFLLILSCMCQNI